MERIDDLFNTTRTCSVNNMEAAYSNRTPGQQKPEWRTSSANVCKCLVSRVPPHLGFWPKETMAIQKGGYRSGHDETLFSILVIHMFLFAIKFLMHLHPSLLSLRIAGWIPDTSTASQVEYPDSA